jgi:hypothetical protein
MSSDDNDTSPQPQPQPHFFPSAANEIKERLSKYGLDILPSILTETKSVIAGSYPLQCIVGETWEDSDIDIYCKHRIAHEFIEEYLLSLEFVEKLEIDIPKIYSRYVKITNYKIKHDGNEIILDLITTTVYNVVNHMELNLDIDVCKAYFDGDVMFSYTDMNKFENKQASFNQDHCTCGPNGDAGWVRPAFKDQHIRERCRKYLDRGFTIDIISYPKPQEFDSPPLYFDEQIEASPEVHDLILKRLAEYNLDGIGKVLKNHELMMGDFLLNCVLDEHWANTSLIIYSFGSNDLGIFLNEHGYYHEILQPPAVDIFYVPDPQYERGPDREHTDERYPFIQVYPYNGPDTSTICQDRGLDLEHICHDGKRIYSYVSWEKI